MSSNLSFRQHLVVNIAKHRMLLVIDRRKEWMVSEFEF